MERWMQLALEEARKAAQEEEVPVGAVAVLEGELVAREHNRNIQLHDPTGHAEILVLRQAGQNYPTIVSKTWKSTSPSSPAPCVPELCSGHASNNWSSEHGMRRQELFFPKPPYCPKVGSTTRSRSWRVSWPSPRVSSFTNSSLIDVRPPNEVVLRAVVLSRLRAGVPADSLLPSKVWLLLRSVVCFVFELRIFNFERQ